MPARLLAAVCAAAALLAGCSSQPSEAPSPTPAETTAEISEAPAQHGSLAQCLTDHGVPADPGPAGPPAGVDPDAWHEAMQACASFAPGPAG
ncbi:hypothetical protein [Mycolicibacterium elephantis]|uniref:Uncharacterized protein n=1 Tax=Mycolicibacterium elephantis DSM 44368 TaxID=1335622 RepID=A0A439DN10_9MYCO|nr:hypothetical protein [Mycolicibacterium elephantis]MCV7220286.1 hypothetical protein [Mycolicibacterium elephantis]RWA16432.1 hypothetical protein MELE44368_07405 [Mycolicibacterium elephantis DSM 44368]